MMPLLQARTKAFLMIRLSVFAKAQYQSILIAFAKRSTDNHIKISGF